MNQEVCLLPCTEGSLFLLPADDNNNLAVDIWIEVTWQSWQFSKLGTLLRRSWWHYYVVAKCW